MIWSMQCLRFFLSFAELKSVVGRKNFSFSLKNSAHRSLFRWEAGFSPFLREHDNQAKSSLLLSRRLSALLAAMAKLRPFFHSTTDDPVFPFPPPLLKSVRRSSSYGLVVVFPFFV